MLYITIALAILDCAACILLLLAHTKNLRLWLRVQALEKTISNALQHANLVSALGKVEDWPGWRWKDQIDILEPGKARVETPAAVRITRPGGDRSAILEEDR